MNPESLLQKILSHFPPGSTFTHYPQAGLHAIQTQTHEIILVQSTPHSITINHYDPDQSTQIKNLLSHYETSGEPNT